MTTPHSAGTDPKDPPDTEAVEEELAHREATEEDGPDGAAGAEEARTSGMQ